MIDKPGTQATFAPSLEELRKELLSIRMRKQVRIESERRLTEQVGSGQRLPVLEAQSRPGLVPLSYSQERLWVLEQLGLPGGAYTIPAAIRLEGSLDVAALESSFVSLVSRHESLRTRFGRADGVPYQV